MRCRFLAIPCVRQIFLDGHRMWLFSVFPSFRLIPYQVIDGLNVCVNFLFFRPPGGLLIHLCGLRPMNTREQSHLLMHTLPGYNSLATPMWLPDHLSGMGCSHCVVSFSWLSWLDFLSTRCGSSDEHTLLLLLRESRWNRGAQAGHLGGKALQRNGTL